MIFLAKLKRPHFSPGPESSECKLFGLDDIPFDSLAFSSMLVTLNLVRSSPRITSLPNYLSCASSDVCIVLIVLGRYKNRQTQVSLWHHNQKVILPILHFFIYSASYIVKNNITIKSLPLVP